ncbi:MAG TPA: NAD-dependent epimerase/dehydratase family protein [Abditibacteriaceae bacterium]
MPPLPAADLEHILQHASCLEELRGARLFITGGTGFFGCWLLESLVYANEKLNLGATATVLTRDAGAFGRKMPHLANQPALSFWQGDACSFPFPPGDFSHIIHAATEASAQLNSDNPLQMLNTAALGTRRALEFATHCGARRFLLTSSGAVYGTQPSDITHVAEEYAGAPDTTDIGSAYAQGKRFAEFDCTLWHKQFGLETTIARCFALVGPHLPLDAHFAIGNFLRDGMIGGPIRVGGDGTPYRSYLYAADLAIWLWTILLRGEAGRAYNVGSQEDGTIASLAQTVAGCFAPQPAVEIARRPVAGQKASRYVPCTQRAQSELGLRQYITTEEALRKTISWHEQQRGAA